MHWLTRKAGVSPDAVAVCPIQLSRASVICVCCGVSRCSDCEKHCACKICQAGWPALHRGQHIPQLYRLELGPASWHLQHASSCQLHAEYDCGIWPALGRPPLQHEAPFSDNPHRWPWGNCLSDPPPPTLATGDWPVWNAPDWRYMVTDPWLPLPSDLLQLRSLQDAQHIQCSQ